MTEKYDYFDLSHCTLCPHECGVNRIAGELGVCESSADITISHWGLHHGEEPPISGSDGSGTIFFSHCNLSCVFCQNHQISQTPDPEQVKVLSSDELVSVMLSLQNQGAHNINLVSPTHQIGQIVPALLKAKQKGLHIPIVYNTNGYDKRETLQALEGIIDIYLPDMKYGADDQAFYYSGIQHYVKTNRDAVLEMFGQVGELTLGFEGIAKRGLMIRHLVLPNDLSGSRAVLTWIAELSHLLPVSLMSQYAPKHHAQQYSELCRKLSVEEYDSLLDAALDLGLEHCFTQALQSNEQFFPDFENQEPFA